MSLRSSLSSKIQLFEKDFEVYNNIYISNLAILSNFDLFLKLSPGGFVIPVLKSNAYGHGLEQVATILKERNFPYIAVDDYFESLRIHIELETGMSRHGVRINKLKDFLNLIKKYSNLLVEGVMTHLADADNPKSDKFVEQQTKKFDIGVEMIINAGFKLKYVHIAQSAGSTKTKSNYANTIRIGLGLYGITPLDKSDESYDDRCYWH